ncbi:hypothetical protein GCM10025874_03650 [Arenivirga flava]|uniref:Uncharacterized protein n=1 Tax=Arenivirga flava TaxID=1930060 RepID=A0AA37UP35_9MICO|nr:hypothetical protein GCM10025874_03650 [Arenivirga flava]
MDRLAELEHHVVGHIDGQRDRADARQAQPGGDRCGGRPARIEPLDRPRHEAHGAVATADRGVVAQDDVEAGGSSGPAALARLGGRVGERRAGGVGVLAGEAAHREGVAAVRRDVDLDGDVVQAEQGDRVGTRLGIETQLDEP